MRRSTDVGDGPHLLRCNHCRNLICGVRNFHLLKDVWRFGSGVHEKKVKLCHPEKSPPPAAAAQRDQDMAVAAHRPGWQATDLLARLNFSEQAPNHKSGYRTQYRSDFRSCGISSKLQVLCFARSCWVRLQRDTPITFPSSIRLRGRFRHCHQPRRSDITPEQSRKIDRLYTQIEKDDPQLIAPDFRPR